MSLTNGLRGVLTLIRLRNNLVFLHEEFKIVNAAKCTCTSFVLQYESGCQCGKAKRLSEIKLRIDSAGDELTNA